MQWIIPNWQAPVHVNAISTTRIMAGNSLPPFDSFNVGVHVGDHLQHVNYNRQQLIKMFDLPSTPLWLDQVHGYEVAIAGDTASQACLSGQPQLPKADACVSHQSGPVCVVMTADCLPVLMTNKAGTVVSAAHAGWRGLCEGVLEKTIIQMKVPTTDILVWLGPAIGAEYFEVGDEVREAFMQKNISTAQAFTPRKKKGKWLLDIYELARIRLMATGIHRESISGGDYCTYQDQKLFYSYRRDGKTGRMASLIWL